MTIRKALVGLTAASLFASVPAFASSSEGDSSVENELAEMRELVEGLKQRVEAQEEQIDHQAERLEAAQEVVREQREADQKKQDEGYYSALSEFWGGVDVGLSVAGSYAYNFHPPDQNQVGPGAGANQGASGLFYPFHGDHNSFQVDQVWFDISKGTTEESRAGFGFTMLYGNTAAFLGQGANGTSTTVSNDLDGDGIPDVALSGGGTTFGVSGGTRRGGFDSTSDYYVHQAFVSYLAPMGEGVEVTFGKFATLIGAETANAAENWNITRGNIYNLFQPIDHVGLLASTTVGDFDFAAGVVNEIGLGASSFDVNDEKSYLGHVGYSMENAGVGLTVAYGSDGQAPFSTSLADNGEQFGIVDLVATYEGEGFEAWINADYLWNQGHRASAWGIAVAGRVPLTDELSSAIRAEYAQDQGQFFGIADGTGRSRVYSVTGTLAYELAQNLELKGEVRWDRVDNSGEPDEFITATGNGSEDQVVGLAQVVYAF